jgi:predicted permease
MAAHQAIRVSRVVGEQQEQVWIARASANLSSVVGVPPAVGRFLAAEEELPGRDHVIVLSHELWRRHFAGQPDAIGRTVHLSDGSPDGRPEPYTIIGVMPEAFSLPPGVEGWIPLNTSAVGASAEEAVGIVGRLRPAATQETATADLRGVLRSASTAPDSTSASVVSLRESLIRYHARLSSGRFILLAVVAGMLLLTLTNLASLLAAQHPERERDLAIRAALGASRVRLLMPPAVEMTMLVVVGSALGIMLAVAAIPFVSAQFGATAMGVRITSDARVLAVAAALTCACTLVLVSILWRQVARLPVGAALRAGRASGDGRQRRVQAVILCIEIAAAVFVVGTADALVRDFLWVRNAAPGYDPSGLVYVRARPLPTTPNDAIVERVASRVPASHVAIQGDESRVAEYRLQSRQEPLSRTELPFRYVVSADFFRTLGATIEAGRSFARADRVGAPGVAIVNRAAADRLWPGTRAVGERLTITMPDREAAQVTVVGVVSNTRLFVVLGGPDQPVVYRPIEQVSARPRMLLVRSPGSLATVAEGILDATAGLFPERLRRTDVRLVSDYLDLETMVQRFNAKALSAVSTVVLVLAALGIYGVTMHTVASRSREIATRTALGAQRLDIIRLVLGRTALLAAIGLTVGGFGFWLAQRVVRSFFSLNAPPTHAGTWVAAMFIVIAVLAATLLPLHRAAAVDPVSALRGE